MLSGTCKPSKNFVEGWIVSANSLRTPRDNPIAWMRATFLSDSVTQSSDPLALKNYRQHVSALCYNGVGGRSGGGSGIPEPEGRDAIR